MGVIAVGLGKLDQSDEEVAILSSHSGEEGDDQWSNIEGFVRLPYDGQVGFFEGLECEEENVLLRLLEVWVRGGVRPSKEQYVRCNLVRIAWC